MTLIQITDDKCWRCGRDYNLTVSHAIPQYFKPIHNIEYPLCEECHKELHGEDISLMRVFAYKTHKTLREGIRRIDVLRNIVARKKEKEDTMTIGDILKEEMKK